jgi:protein involved in polysaccharide export with SLBB domain
LSAPVWRPRISRALSALGVCLSLSTAAGQTTSPGEEPGLQPGDRVLITVWRKPELTGESTVMVDGTLNHPLYQTIEVAGVPLAVVKQRLLAYLSQTETDPLLTVEALFRVTVGGEVRQPNVYMLPSSATVSQAIAGAGGPTELGRLSNVRLYRGSQQLRLDLNDPRSEQANMRIRSGDNLIVGRSKNFFRDVLAPGASLIGAVLSIVVVLRQ